LACHIDEVHLDTPHCFAQKNIALLVNCVPSLMTEGEIEVSTI
jgi:hypothetical protein